VTDGDDAAPASLRLDDVPVRAFLESQDHQEDLVRELQLIRIGEREHGMAEPPQELARLVSAILQRYSDVRTSTRAQAAAALKRGETACTLDVPVRAGMADALREWLRLLEAADAICEQGDAMLLTASRPDVRELRRWYVRELTQRLEGQH
jgi:hypothetical protein